MPTITLTEKEHKALIGIMSKIMQTNVNVGHKQKPSKPKHSKAQIKADAMNKLLKQCPTIETFLK